MAKRKSKILQVSFLASSVLVGLYAGRATFLLAQEEVGGGANRPTATFENGQAEAQLPIKHAPNFKITEQEYRGAGIFFQRCALCHLPKTNSKACCSPSLGPNLTVSFKNVTPDKEKVLREIILKGGPTFMPGWQYALEPKDIDDIIAYLKTLS